MEMRSAAVHIASLCIYLSVYLRKWWMNFRETFVRVAVAPALYWCRNMAESRYSKYFAARMAMQ